MNIKLLPLLLAATTLLGFNAHAATPQEFLKTFAVEAHKENPAFKEFSASRGEKMYHAQRAHSGGKQISCASCHTDNPKNSGAHEKTRKAIEPLAPGANPKRFTDVAEVEKWFRRNCQDVLERQCSAQEKGDFLSYLLSVK